MLPIIATALSQLLAMRAMLLFAMPTYQSSSYLPTFIYEIFNNNDQHHHIHRTWFIILVITPTTTTRFYSSSLLIMYDALSQDQDVPSSCHDPLPHDSPHQQYDSPNQDDSLDQQYDSSDQQYDSAYHDVGGRRGEEGSVKVRMIDFAHATHKGLDEESHQGPDRGYIFGLTNLIQLFHEKQHMHHQLFPWFFCFINKSLSLSLEWGLYDH